METLSFFIPSTTLNSCSINDYFHYPSLSAMRVFSRTFLCWEQSIEWVFFFLDARVVVLIPHSLRCGYSLARSCVGNVQLNGISFSLTLTSYMVIHSATVDSRSICNRIRHHSLPMQVHNNLRLLLYRRRFSLSLSVSDASILSHVLALRNIQLNVVFFFR